MGFRINTNVAALTAHTSSVKNNTNLDNSLSKLSSGLRINKAADDASGLAIANSLRAQASSLGQAVSNGNDAIGLIQTADGALSEYSDILNTIKTKSVQAASDGQNSSSRLAIQKDIDRLLEGLNNIAKTTSFNGQKLLSGTFTNKEFQVGANANETIKASIGSTETSQVGQTTNARLDFQGEGVNQLTLVNSGTGKSITLEPFELLSNNKQANGMGAVADQLNKYTADTGISAKAVVSVSTGSITSGTTGTDFKINGVLIGAVNVSANDSTGTLLNAINKKTSETGVVATKNQDGTLMLSSKDGRAIETTGTLNVTGSTTSEMSTLGYLEVSQVGSSTFQIKGADNAAAVGADITVSASKMNATVDSELAIGSTVEASSTMAAGTVLGFKLDTTNKMAGDETVADTLLAVGSIISSGSKIAKGTVIGAKITTSGSTTLKSTDNSMLVKAGSVLASGSTLGAGTVLQQNITINSVDYKAGTILTVAVSLDSDQSMTLSKDMVLTNSANSGQESIIGSGSVLMAGTVLGADFTLGADATLASDMMLKAGSTLMTGSTMAVGSVLGYDVKLSGSATTTAVTSLKAGSILMTGSILKQGSTIGGTIVIDGGLTLKEDMAIKAGSILLTGTVLKAGTKLEQDLTAAQAGDADGVGLKAGTVLGTDITTGDKINVIKDFVMLKGTSGDDATIKDGSTLAANGAGQNSVTLGDEEFTNLSDIDVTTLQGAMRAITTVAAAMTDLDTIRSDLGSVQNQLTSTINNISVTQVNVKSAESNIRDVDFAEESANFSKFNILAQSGSYAMSQANSIQQNVLKLLQ